jgi:hypothetical protein
MYIHTHALTLASVVAIFDSEFYIIQIRSVAKFSDIRGEQHHPRQKLPTLQKYINTVEPSYNDIGLSDTSFIASDIP